jgi:arylsulfatase A-like enzyme
MHHMLRRDEPCLLRTLKNAGWFVWWGGKNDLVPAQDGYDAFCDVKYRENTPRAGLTPRTDLHGRDDWRGARGSDTFYSFYYGRLDKGPEAVYYDHDWRNVFGAVDFLSNVPKGRPFCVYLPLGYPHPPYAVEEPFFSAIDRRKLPPRVSDDLDWSCKPALVRGIRRGQNLTAWTEERWTELRATYYGMCSRVDHQFGRVMDALRKAGLYDATVVFVFSDHGDFTGDYGLVEKTQNTFEDCLTRVPFLIKPPAWHPAKARVSDALVELVDFPATVEAMCGLTPEHTHFGRSLLPVLAGDTDEHRDAVFCEGGRLHGEEHGMEKVPGAVTNDGGLYWPRISLQHGEGPEHGKAVMCRTRDMKYVRRLYEKDELYDLRHDPGEVKNLAGEAAFAKKLAVLKERMLAFFLETADAVPHDLDRRG